MRRTRNLSNVELYQDDHGEYWLSFYSASEDRSERMGLSRGASQSAARRRMEAWAEEQLQRSESASNNVP